MCGASYASDIWSVGCTVSAHQRPRALRTRPNLLTPLLSSFGWFASLHLVRLPLLQSTANCRISLKVSVFDFRCFVPRKPEKGVYHT